jgi:hypothetical protein
LLYSFLAACPSVIRASLRKVSFISFRFVSFAGWFVGLLARWFVRSLVCWCWFVAERCVAKKLHVDSYQYWTLHLHSEFTAKHKNIDRDADCLSSKNNTIYASKLSWIAQ